MTTPRIRSLVSLAALTVAFTLGGCASAPSHLSVRDESVASDGHPPAIRFDNDGGERVDVYLIGQQREWLLGRVEPAARATLRIPDAALAENAGSMRLAVLKGDRLTLRAAADPRAAITIIQPVAAILSQRWTFSPTSGQLTSFPLGRGRAEVGRP